MYRKERVVHEEIKNIHGKNLSLLYSEDLKLIRLAPAYDIVSTIVYETSTEKMALRVGDVYKLSDIRKGDFEKEAKKVGLGKNIAMKRFDSMSGKFLKAINEANEQLMDKGFRTEQLKEKILSKGGIAYITMNLRWGNNVYTTGPYIQRYSGKILPAVAG